MNIISPTGIIDTKKQAVILVFNNDDEMSSFISLLVKTPVRSTGMRIVSLVDEKSELTVLQESLLNVIKGLDGVGGNDNDSVIDDSIDGLKDILNS